jgi:hypothetical protein
MFSCCFIYLSIVDYVLIFVELGGNSFSFLLDLKTKKHVHLGVSIQEHK